MALKIRLQRHGSLGKPRYVIVVADSRSARNGKCLARIGTYNPMPEKSVVTLKAELYDEWFKKGARPSNCVKHLVRIYQGNSQVQGSVHGST